MEERNLGERDHSWIQGRLVSFFLSRFRETGIAALPEWRFQTKSTRFQDTGCRGHAGQAGRENSNQATAFCALKFFLLKIRFLRTNERIQEYLDFGVPVIWLVDPAERAVWIYRRNGMEQASDPAKLDGTSIEIPFSEIFD